MKSRALSLGVCFAAIVFVFYRLQELTIKIKLGLIFLFISLIVIASLLIKSDSSKGRVLIYKISMPMLTKNWPVGIGLDKFKSIYMNYQAGYFSKSKYSEKELLLADNTYFAFNDYYQFIIETGFTGLFLSIFLFVYVYYLTDFFLRRKTINIWIDFFISCILVLTIASFFNFFLHIKIVQLLYVNCLLLLSIARFKSKQSILKLTFVTILLLVNFSLIYQIVDNTLFLQKIQTVRDLERSGNLHDSFLLITEIEGKEVSSENLAELLEVKSRVAYGLHQLEIAEATALKLAGIKPSNLIYSRLGSIYKHKGELANAERAFVKAVNMVPNRFVERYRLYQFYLETNDNKKAESCRRKILSLPIKVPSEMIKNIEFELKR